MMKLKAGAGLYFVLTMSLALSNGCGGSSGSGSDPAPAAIPGAEATAASGNAASGGSSLTEELGGIETVAMDSTYQIGAGGGFYFLPSPVIVFKDGSLCEDIDFFTEGLDAAAHRAKHPNSWTKWRMENGVRQVQDSKGDWGNIGYGEEYAPLPKGTTFAASFTNTSGGGDTSLGGSTITLALSRIELRADSRFVQGKFVSASSSGTTVGSAPADQQGSYEIDGYLIALRYDDGNTVVRSLVIDPAYTKILWLD
ncbi:MAG: hypothetical protein EOP07_08910 [Proteobacteria bacterium]|nr:MAG: hypothetical protein EOP07_08910 [Pseudomonadota bacterium]